MKFKIEDTVFGKEKYGDKWYAGKIVLCDDYRCLIATLDEDYKCYWLDTDSTHLVLSKNSSDDESKSSDFDLNKLTTEELRIYCDLVDDVSEAQHSLDEFIKAHNK